MAKIITVTEEQAEELSDEESVTLADGTTLDWVEQGDWDDDGKYSSADLIIKDGNGTHYRGYVTRSGSYFTDYDYQYGTDFHEVEKKEVVRLEWQVVK